MGNKARMKFVITTDESVMGQLWALLVASNEFSVEELEGMSDEEILAYSLPIDYGKIERVSL